VKKINASGNYWTDHNGLLNLAWINLNISVIMAKILKIMEGQPILIGRLHLVISLTILLLLVEIPMTVDQAPSQLNYSILIQINGRQKLHFLTAQNRELIFE